MSLRETTGGRGDSGASRTGSPQVLAYVSADEVVPVFDDSPRSDADSANFL